MTSQRGGSTVPREPAYLALLRSGEIERRVRLALDELEACTVCPRDCRVDRLHAVPPEGELGIPLKAERMPGEAPKRTVPRPYRQGDIVLRRPLRPGLVGLPRRR